MINLSSAPEVLQSTAQNYAREAIKFDSQGSRGSAIQMYQKAIESLIKLTKLYPNEPHTQLYVKHAKRYQERINELQNNSDNPQTNQSDSQSGVVEVVKASRKPAEPPYEYKEKGVHAVYAGKSAQSSTSRVKRLTHFFVALGMDGFKESTFKKLYDLGYTSPLKIKRIRVKDLEGVESFGTQTIKKLISEVDKCLNAPNFVNFAVASGYIDNFSLERVQKIVDAYGEEVFEWEDESTQYIVDKVQALHGFKQIARNFAVALPKIFKLADNLSVDLELPQKEEAVGDLLDGEKITLTGARDKEVQAWITQQGGTVQNMKADTTMLIIKDESYTSSKVDLAEERNIPILTLEQFRRKYM